jgi:hypothetical protein
MRSYHLNIRLSGIFLAQEVKKSNPDLPPTEIVKKLGEMWQKMSCNFLNYYSPLYAPSASFSDPCYIFRLRSQIQ